MDGPCTGGPFAWTGHAWMSHTRMSRTWMAQCLPDGSRPPAPNPPTNPNTPRGTARPISAQHSSETARNGGCRNEMTPERCEPNARGEAMPRGREGEGTWGIAGGGDQPAQTAQGGATGASATCVAAVCVCVCGGAESGSARGFEGRFIRRIWATQRVLGPVC